LRFAHNVSYVVIDNPIPLSLVVDEKPEKEESSWNMKKAPKKKTSDDRRQEKARKPFNLKLWISSTFDNLKASLFFSPMLAVFVAIGLAIGLTYLDEELTDTVDYPGAFATTVDSARSVLSTVAGATISFAGTAFSVSLLVFQLGSSQYSPRIVHTLFRDPFNRRIMALTVGTFTYCLVVMRAVRLPAGQAEGASDAVVPTISVTVAVILGIISILAIVAFIDHSAHSIDISELLEQVTREAIMTLERTWLFEKEADKSNKDTESELDNSNHLKEIPEAHVVRFVSSGWVQEINLKGLEELVPPGGFIKLHTISGRYSLPECAICSVVGLGDKDEEELKEFDQCVRNLIAVGRSRTMRDDPAFGLRQIVDVTLRALSPGVNDPTTAQDGIFHAAAIVIEFLQREPPPTIIKTEHGGELILDEQQTHDGIVKLAYNEVRVCAGTSPTVCMYLIESLRLIRESLVNGGFKDRAPEIERQVQLIEAGCQNASHVHFDHEFVSKVVRDRFPDLMPIRSDYKQALMNDL